MKKKLLLFIFSLTLSCYSGNIISIIKRRTYYIRNESVQLIIIKHKNTTYTLQNHTERFLYCWNQDTLTFSFENDSEDECHKIHITINPDHNCAVIQKEPADRFFNTPSIKFETVGFKK